MHEAPHRIAFPADPGKGSRFIGRAGNRKVQAPAFIEYPQMRSASPQRTQCALAAPRPPRDGLPSIDRAGSPSAILVWLEAFEGPANTSIQNISGLPQGLAGISVAG